ncbi:MAG: alpha/beta hydrolase [Actinomycetota bacterium]|nr:alpha/beta hydrolase [Actinomycetota bacterium]
MDQLDRVVDVAGAPIRYSVSGQGTTTIALTHGFRAHHLWWAAVEPLLAKKYQVVQLDISGSGDSGHRERYSIETWGQEVNAVLADAGIERAMLVGHSLGGTSVVMAATQEPDRAIGVILFDTFIEGEGRFRPIGAAASAPVRVYPSREDGEARFRLMPTQEDVDPEILARIAAYGVKEIPEGWTWKFDQIVAPVIDEELFNASIAGLTVPFHYVHAGQSAVVKPEVVPFLLGFAPDGSEYTLVPGAHHHVPLSHPEICAQIIEEYATLWTATA